MTLSAVSIGINLRKPNQWEVWKKMTCNPNSWVEFTVSQLRNLIMEITQSVVQLHLMSNTQLWSRFSISSMNGMCRNVSWVTRDACAKKKRTEFRLRKGTLLARTKQIWKRMSNWSIWLVKMKWVWLVSSSTKCSIKAKIRSCNRDVKSSWANLKKVDNITITRLQWQTKKPQSPDSSNMVGRRVT